MLRKRWAPAVSSGEALRAGGAQGAVQLGIEPAGLAQLGQEGLLRGVDVAGQRPQLAAGTPDGVGLDDQARLVGGLQPELDVPVLVVVGLDQPEAGPYRAGDGVGLPACERGDRGRPPAAGSAAKVRSVPVSAASQARVAGVPARPRLSRSEPSAARAAASTRASRASAQTVKLWSGSAAPRAGGIDAASTRAQAASGPVSTGRQTARGGSSRAIGRTRPRVTRSAAKAARSRRWWTDSPYAAPSASASAGAGPRTRRRPRARRSGPARRRVSTSPALSPISSRTSSGELTGAPPRVGRVRVAVPSVAVGRRRQEGADRLAPMRRTGGSGRGVGRPGRRGGVVGADESSAHSASRLGRAGGIDQPAGVQDEHRRYLPLSSAGPGGASACQPGAASRRRGAPRSDLTETAATPGSQLFSLPGPTELSPARASPDLGLSKERVL